MIKHAAIRAGGKIYTGRRHSDAIYAAITADEEFPFPKEDQGFVNDKGVFLSRIEAREEAIRCGQINDRHRGEPLISEELW